MFQADPRGILALLAVTQCWALAVVLLRAGVPGSAARRLALLLVFEGWNLGTSDAIFYLVVSPEDLLAKYSWFGPAQWAIHAIGDCGMLALYPPFLAAALRTRFTAPFSDQRVRIALVVVVAALYVAAQLTPWQVGNSMVYVAMALLFLYAFVVSIHAWHRATGTARARALIFLLAFGFRDVCWDFIYLSNLHDIWTDTVPPGINPRTIVYILGTLVSVPLIAYGILRTQLFDIDLKLRWTIKQSTLAAAGVSIMFLVSEGASQFLSAELGNVAGLLVAAAVMFFLTPLQRFAERVASAAMPNTSNTPEYVAFRKMQVYEEALAEAMHEEGISPKERALLVRLRDSLGISAADALAIEGELQARMQDKSDTTQEDLRLTEPKSGR